jgi:hypothetical protein
MDIFAFPDFLDFADYADPAIRAGCDQGIAKSGATRPLTA